MKKIVLSIIITLMLLPAIAQKEGSFTMNINQSKTGNNKKIEATAIDFAFKGDKFLIKPRMIGEGSEQSPSILFDLKKKEMVVMVNAEGTKSAMVMDMPDLANQEMMKNKDYKPEDFKVTTTKERKTIEGYEAVKVNVVGKDMNSEMWVTDQVNFDFNDLTKMFGAGMSEGTAMFDMKSYGIGGFPLMVIVKDKKGNEEMLMTISNIKNKVNDNIFSVEGYQKMDMKKGK